MTLRPIHVAAAQRRRESRAKAQKMGVDEAYLSILVDRFYDRIRQDPALGPIFEQAIGDRWTPHLARMKDFWASVALAAGRYSGQPVPAHQKLTSVEPRHFQIWLGLFRQTLEDTAPSQEAVDYLMEKAERIADSLRMAMAHRSDGPPSLT